MTRVLAFADSHIGCGGEHRRDALADQMAVLDQIAALTEDRAVDVLVHGGDVFHRSKPAPAELHVFKRFVGMVGCPVIAIHGNGNHEAAFGDRSALELFAAPALRVSRRAEMLTYPTVTICTLPAVPLAQLAANANGASRNRLQDTALELLLRAAADLRAEASADRPCVLLGHWALEGLNLPTGLPTDALSEPTLPLLALEEMGYDACLFGHIHNATAVADRIISLGSPMTHDFGESSVPHGCWILEFGDDVFEGYEYEFIPLESRRFVTVDVDLSENQDRFVGAMEDCGTYDQYIELDETDRIAAEIVAQGNGLLEGAVVRVRYRASEEQRRRVDHAALLRLLEDAGAHRVYGGIQCDVVRERRARAPEVDEGLAPLQAVERWLAAQEVDEGQAAGLRALLGGWLAET